eukprot:TRINITY_DN49746_c0_g1_i1.p1 TRINITY_DN49746_c0_g1~~TRINITY_DN49746_c0_g1_i1.p1  ORF type:complete len:245 (+),score=57.74 TRINITY_DN49746_c0_g1_i1:42-737(+)
MAADMRDVLDDGYTGSGGPHQPARVVEPPSGRLRAARVAESGTLGGGPPSQQVTILPYEDLQKQHQAADDVIEPQEALRQLVAARQPGSTVSEEESAAILAKGGFIWFALSDNGRKPAGYVSLTKHTADPTGGAAGTGEPPDEGASQMWELADMLVSPAFDADKVGRLLIQTLLRQFEEAAGVADELVLRLTTYEAAEGLFQQCGFRDEVDSPIPSLPGCCKRLIRPPARG